MRELAGSGSQHDNIPQRDEALRYHVKNHR